ncbi:hypothetical protein [Butyrivibrio fibrisolvens]|nr:hypothetical protein [Butyrivibrio fibrisolvens]
MPIIFIPENNEYNPLELEPYRSFNKKFEDREDDIDGALIKLSIPNQRRRFVDRFSVDRYYCDDITLKFMFSHIHEIGNGNDSLIHHVIEYDSASSIQISIDLVESGDPYETLDCVCHEMYHAGQARYVEIFESLDEDAQRSYFLHDASVYADEFNNYKNAIMADDESDYLEYYGQWCEQDAREYAYKSVLDYYSRINEYLEQSGGSSDK